ncbi:Putative CAMK/CAMKL/KIN4 protein kinase [Rhizopus microsporus]|nr:Putative CAMK/CAMKL/KIN4 protein kinase [Rhizopus microsporus]
MSVIVTRSCDIIRHDANHEAIVDIKRKKIPRLGPFLLLKTLGVGEFGKVKMGKHIETDQKVYFNHVQYHHMPNVFNARFYRYNAFCVLVYKKKLLEKEPEEEKEGVNYYIHWPHWHKKTLSGQTERREADDIINLSKK